MTGAKLEALSLPNVSKISRNISGKNVNIQCVKMYFSAYTWDDLKILISTKKDHHGHHH